MIVSAQQFDVSTTSGTASFTYADGTKGTFSNVSATIHFDLSDLSSGSISGSVDVSTIDTQNKLRNNHLKEKNFFDVENYPKMTFESTSISDENGVLLIVGNLTIKETTKEVEFVAYNREGQLTFIGSVYGADFDVATSKKREKTLVGITVKTPI